MLGRDEEYFSVLERAHRLHVENGDLLRAARAAYWLGLQLTLRGEIGGATGWNSRAQRLVDRAGRDSVEQGYLVLAEGFAQAMESDWEAALETTRASAEIAERHGDADLLALALMDQGQYLMRLGRVDGGLRFLDEAMVAVTTGELSPIVTGLVYCSVIDGCHEASRAAPGAGVDGRPDALVRGAARHGLVHRHLPGAPRRDHAVARILGGRARGGPQGCGPGWDEPRGRCPGPLPGG